MSELNPSRVTESRVRHPALLGMWLLLVTAYLVASVTGHVFISMGVVSLMVGALIAASGRLVSGVLIGSALAGLCLYGSTSMQFVLYAPPLAAFAFMAFFFGRTLRAGSEALITRVARKEHADLPADMLQHSQRLTWVWTLCFVLLFLTALLLAPLLPFDVWSRWIHALGYSVPATLFLGEHVYRHFRFRQHPHGSLAVLIRNIIVVTKEIAMSNASQETESGR